jgi:ATP-dependent DNA ligase
MPSPLGTSSGWVRGPSPGRWRAGPFSTALGPLPVSTVWPAYPPAVRDPLCPPLPPTGLTTVTRLPAGSGWSFEPKYDGFRVLAFARSAGVVLQSRQLRDLTSAFPDVAAAVAALGDVVLDGELVVWRAGRFDFAALQDRLRAARARTRSLMAAPAAYMVFDLLARDEKILLDRPYATRRRKLEKLAARGLPDGLVLTPATADPAVARSWMLGHGHTGIEGVVAKRLDQPYRPGRGVWQKLRTLSGSRTRPWRLISEHRSEPITAGHERARRSGTPQECGSIAWCR